MYIHISVLVNYVTLASVCYRLSMFHAYDIQCIYMWIMHIAIVCEMIYE